MKIKRAEAKNGRVLYYVNGKLTSESALPSNVKLEGTQEIDYQPTEADLPHFNSKICVFDDEPATHQKFLLERMVGLCDEHYPLKTGAVAQEMKKRLYE
ncbi:MAG TPA: hypothetical protein VFL85_03215 [Candidatus Saccharimonadales bacterium]|nr:hypothetical protein [Candidatus Saccharimonadales bacterium]